MYFLNFYFCYIYKYKNSRCYKLDKIVIPKIASDDYLHKSAEFWKNYRELLWKKIKEEELNPVEKTEENIINLAQQIGIKATARYFNITPSTVRYYINKEE